MLIGSLEGRKNFRVGIHLKKNLLGKGYRKQTTLFFRPFCTIHFMKVEDIANEGFCCISFFLIFFTKGG